MNKKILIIDDDPEFVEAAARLLTAKGYRAVSAEDSVSGFNLAHSESPNLILLDVMMTKKTEGFDAARALKSDEKVRAIPVILITGIRKEMNLHFGLEPDEEWLPVKTVLEKPVKPDVLLKAVEEHIA